MVKQQCLLHFPELAGRIEVVHNGGDPPRPGPVEDASSRETLLRGVNLRASRTTALFLGHDYVRKGLTEAIRGLAAALRVAPELPLQLLVGGRGRHQPYQRLAARLGVATRVGFAGTRYPTEELLQASDLLVLPTFFDAFANVTVEALSAGRPVLTSTANGAHEILTHGKDSWLIPDPRDSLQMAEHFLELRDPGVLAARQREALRTAGRYRLQQQLSRIEQHMLDVAGHENRSRAGAPS
jgi:UDP-glucose:(heptosyl)LPS alpha-1,3-glucosyltransferase